MVRSKPCNRDRNNPFLQLRNFRSSFFLSVTFIAVLSGCARGERAELRDVEAMSLLGSALHRPVLAGDSKKALESNLASARTKFDQDPDNIENIIWLGRRTAYLWRYREAIDIFTRGIERFPSEPKLYRHRGHRYISVREFARALADFETAYSLIREIPDSLEPDGAPNKYNIPRSTNHSNILYHLGLTRYLLGDFEGATEAYRRCLEGSFMNDDLLCASTDWLYMALRRLGQHDEATTVLASISPKMQILEDSAYHRRLLMYKGIIPADSLLPTESATDLEIATYGYGVGNWFLCNGDTTRAVQIFESVVKGRHWSAFGYIAAEADLWRLRR